MTIIRSLALVLTLFVAAAIPQQARTQDFHNIGDGLICRIDSYVYPRGENGLYYRDPRPASPRTRFA